MYKHGAQKGTGALQRALSRVGDQQAAQQRRVARKAAATVADGGHQDLPAGEEEGGRLVAVPTELGGWPDAVWGPDARLGGGDGWPTTARAGLEGCAVVAAVGTPCGGRQGLRFSPQAGLRRQQ